MPTTPQETAPVAFGLRQSENSDAPFGLFQLKVTRGDGLQVVAMVGLKVLLVVVVVEVAGAVGVVVVDVVGGVDVATEGGQAILLRVTTSE